MTPNIDVQHLDIKANEYDIRRDLFWFTQYCLDHEIKRSVYGNNLSKSEYKRIAKKLGRPELMDDYDKDMGLWWIDFIDEMALKFGWIEYDTKGVYQGYSSQRPSFQDNYIEVDEVNFHRFLNLSALEQEKYLYRHFKESDGGNNPLIDRGTFSSLDRFERWGSATGVLPTLNFAKSKAILLDVLATLAPNTWYATADLIQLMKDKHPWFLIPKKVTILENAGWREPKKKVVYPRYYNFVETDGPYRGRGRLEDIHIKDEDPKGFEKVEGRFIERFIEGYLYTLGYVNIGMSKVPYTGKKPIMGTLSAFKLDATFFHVLQNKPFTAKVSIQPNFEIYIDAPLYPIATLNSLDPLTSIVKEDRQIILKLEKQYVLNYLVDNPNFKIGEFLTELSDTPIPQNVLMEIKEWSERTDVFTLYEGFGLYEGLKKQPLADIHTEVSITPTLRLIRRSTLLYDKLQKTEAIPMWIQHKEKSFQTLPKQAKSIFPSQKIVKAKKVAKQKITIERKEMLTYTISHKAFYEALLVAILKARFPIEFDKEKRTISFLKSEEAKMKTILNDFKATYQISIKK
ncbi:MAG: hypothetical protein AB8G86_19735 [Saprospiraceae bacterium]